MQIVRVETRHIGEFRGKRSRIYFWIDGGHLKTGYDPDSMAEYTRLLPEVLARLSIDAAVVKPKWHHNAGYRIPGTPGFYANRILRDSEGEAIDIHVRVE